MLAHSAATPANSIFTGSVAIPYTQNVQNDKQVAQLKGFTFTRKRCSMYWYGSDISIVASKTPVMIE